jgi:hypothetical protein
MKNFVAISLTVGFLAIFAVSLNAQSVYSEYAMRDGLRLLEIGKALSQIPETAPKPEDYVPPHWRITDRAEGDLNADGIKDFAFTMMLDEKDTAYIASLEKLYKDSSWIDKTFIIAVVDSRGDRKMHLNAINYNLYGDTDAPARNGDQRDEFKIDIKKNVLDVHVNYGGMMRSMATFHFRLDPPTGGDLVLIGFDFETACVTLTDNCGMWRLSENYLTNTRIETDYKFDAQGKAVGTDKKTPLAPVKIQFMNARLSDSNQKSYTRPF